MKISALLLLLFVSFAVCHNHPRNDPCYVLGLDSSYDAVVAGSGPGGSVSARRLAEHNGRKVLQVERGPAYANCPLCAPADDGVQIAFSPGFSYTWPLEPQAYIPNHPVLFNLEAALQGGASSHNGMVWIRPDGRNYFPKYFPAGWSWETMLPYFAKTENYTFPDGFYGHGNHFDYAANYRGNNGLIQVTQLDTSYSLGFEKTWIEKTKIAWPNIPAFENSSLNNGFYGGSGVSPPEENIHGADAAGFNGIRSSAFPAYISTYPGHNLRAISLVRVNKILFTGTKVSGVQLVFVNTSGFANSSTCTVYTNNVIVSGGPFGTPKLLMLSGIGPAHALHKLGISVVVDSPQVGQNIDNQFGSALAGVPINNIAKWQAPGFTFYNIQDDPNAPNNFFLQMDVLNLPPSPDYITSLNFDLCYAQTRGNMTLASANPDDQVLLSYNFLSTANETALMTQILVKTLQMRALLNITLLSDPCTGHDCSTPTKQLNVWLAANTISPSLHWTGSAALGRVIDPNTMGVYGTTGLYVIDSSAVPATPGANTQSVTYAVAERGIQLAINDIEGCHGW